jgi:flavin-dependent dehydrogenase
MNKFDIIIVGTGPAGLFTARELEHDFSVAVLEKNPAIGNYGNRVVSKSVFKQLRVSDACITEPINEFHFVSPNSTEKIIYENSRGFVIQRAKVQREISNQLTAARLFLKNPISDIDFKRKTLHSARGAYKYDVLLAADGAGSTVRNALKIATPTTINCYSRVFDNTAGVTSCVISNNLAHGFYGWSISLAGKLEVGLGSYADPEQKFAPFVQQFRLHKNEFGPVLHTIRGTILRAPIDKKLYDDCVLIGDAAGGEPLMGSSIHKSIDEAQIAADLIRKDDLETYDEAWINKFGKDFAMQRAIREKIESSPDARIDELFMRKQNITSEGLVNGLFAELLKM